MAAGAAARAIALAMGCLAVAAACKRAPSSAQGQSTPAAAQTIESTGKVLGVGIGTSMNEARAKLDPLRVADERAPDRKEKAGTRVYWKLKETEYDWIIAWANREGEITRLRAMLRRERAKPFAEIGELSRATVNLPERAVWDIKHEDGEHFRLVAEGREQRAATLYMFGFGAEGEDD